MADKSKATTDTNTPNAAVEAENAVRGMELTDYMVAVDDAFYGAKRDNTGVLRKGAYTPNQEWYEEQRRQGIEPATAAKTWADEYNDKK